MTDIPEDFKVAEVVFDASKALIQDILPEASGAADQASHAEIPEGIRAIWRQSDAELRASSLTQWQTLVSAPTKEPIHSLREILGIKF